MSMARMEGLVDRGNAVVEQLLDHFELASSGTWQERHQAYADYHQFSLRNRAGWTYIGAGIEVRNCSTRTRKPDGATAPEVEVVRAGRFDRCDRREQPDASQRLHRPEAGGRVHSFHT